MEQPQSGFMAKWSEFMGWVDARFPATETYEYHMSKYYAPKNFNFWYFFGIMSTVVLVLQLVTGIWQSFSPSSWWKLRIMGESMV